MVQIYTRTKYLLGPKHSIPQPKWNGDQSGIDNYGWDLGTPCYGLHQLYI